MSLKVEYQFRMVVLVEVKIHGIITINIDPVIRLENPVDDFALLGKGS